MSGFFLTNPSGLWALAALAAVVVFYLFYRRYRPLAVTGLFLWGEPRRDGKGGRKLDRPHFGRSFLLDALAACLFALALAGPAWRDSGLPVVAILDDCFSMRAREAHVEGARLAGDLLRKTARGGRAAALILAGGRPSVLRGMGDWNAGEVDGVLARYEPSDRDGDLQAAVSLVRDLYGPELEIHIFSNRDDRIPVPGEGGRAVLHVLPGRGDNLCLGELWRESDPARRGGEKLILSVVNHGARAAESTLTVDTLAGEISRTLYEEKILLGPGERLAREIPLSAAGSETLSVAVRSGGEDVIADDSVAAVPPNPSRQVFYHIENLDPEAERLVRLALEAAGCRRSIAPEAADLLVTSAPLGSGRALTLEILPENRPGWLSPPYVVDFASPLCRDIDLSSATWAAATPEPPASLARVLIAAGDFPLYWQSEPGRLHLNLAVGKSDLVADPAWPVLLANVAARAAELRPGLGASLYRPGETLRYVRERGEAARPLRLLSNNGESAASASGAAFAMPAACGLYRLFAGGEEIGPAAVAPLYGRASDAKGLAESPATLRLGTAAEEGEAGVFDLAWLALALAFAALAANWRRGTA